MRRSIVDRYDRLRVGIIQKQTLPGYSDAVWVRDSVDRKFMSGYVFLVDKQYSGRRAGNKTASAHLR